MSYCVNIIIMIGFILRRIFEFILQKLKRNSNYNEISAKFLVPPFNTATIAHHRPLLLLVFVGPCQGKEREARTCNIVVTDIYCGPLFNLRHHSIVDKETTKTNHGQRPNKLNPILDGRRPARGWVAVSHFIVVHLFDWKYALNPPLWPPPYDRTSIPKGHGPAAPSIAYCPI